MNRLLAWAAVAIAIVLLLWRIDHLANDRETLVRERDQLSARAASLQNTLRLQRELIAEAEEFDRRTNQELADAQAENAKLRDAVADGTKRLRIKASCPRVSSDTGAASMDDAGAAELDPSARQDYFALRDQLILTERALSGLQDWARARQGEAFNGN